MSSMVITFGELIDGSVKFRSLMDALDTSTPRGRIFCHVIVSLAQMDGDLIHDRTTAGLAGAPTTFRIG